MDFYGFLNELGSTVRSEYELPARKKEIDYSSERYRTLKELFGSNEEMIEKLY